MVLPGRDKLLVKLRALQGVGLVGGDGADAAGAGGGGGGGRQVGQAGELQVGGGEVELAEEGLVGRRHPLCQLTVAYCRYMAWLIFALVGVASTRLVALKNSQLLHLLH